MAWVGCLEDGMQWGMQGMEQGRRPTITTSQCCTVVSIDTRTAVVRFLGWHTCAWVGVHPGFGKPLPIALSSKFDPPQAAASVIRHCATKCASMNNSPQLWTDSHAYTLSPTRMSAPKMVWDIVALMGDGWQTFSLPSAHQRGCCGCTHQCFFRRISMYPIT